MRKPRTSRFHRKSIPGSLDDAQRMAAYNQSVVDTSTSWSAVQRAKRMLENLAPHLERLERQAATAATQRADLAATADGLVVWNGTIARESGLQPSQVGRDAT